MKICAYGNCPVECECHDEATRKLESANTALKKYEADDVRYLKRLKDMDLQLTVAKAETAESCAKIIDSFDTSQWSDTQRNVIRIIAHKIRESFSV